METKSITILLLEDSSDTCKEFKDYIDTRNDIKLVATTNSSLDAIKLTKQFKPNTIIVDLELHNGYGTGFDFLSQLRNLDLNFSPLVVVNTNVKSPVIYENLHNGFADLIFYKKQEGYSIEYIINAIIFSQKNSSTSINSSNSSTNSTEDLKINEEKRMAKLINYELDCVGINQKLRGRNYIFDAIKYMLTVDSSKFREVSPLQHVAQLYGMFPSSVGRGIQTVINSAWNKTSIEDLEASYKAKINIDTGVPTAMEFIFYYYNKIKEQL